jgi:hypothetical protein
MDAEDKEIEDKAATIAAKSITERFKGKGPLSRPSYSAGGRANKFWKTNAGGRNYNSFPTHSS